MIVFYALGLNFSFLNIFFFYNYFFESFSSKSMPISDKACFDLFYQNAKNLYDFDIAGYN